MPIRDIELRSICHHIETEREGDDLEWKVEPTEKGAWVGRLQTPHTRVLIEPYDDSCVKVSFDYKHHNAGDIRQMVITTGAWYGEAPDRYWLNDHQLLAEAINDQIA